MLTASVTTGWGSAPTLNDNPLSVGQTTVQARHITELRDAINALRSHLNLSAYSWQYSATTNDYISANPILEMRTALDQALGAPSGGYSAGLAQGQLVRAIQIQELRDRVLAAWQSGSGVDIRWMVTDQLGTPRMIFDQSGSLANVSRHDYLPFGEELSAGTGGRTPQQGYSASDGVRQKFTRKERDIETGLDFFEARYYASTQGRFTSADPYNIVFEKEVTAARNPQKAETEFVKYLGQPQNWNRYGYVTNNPLKFTDPTGEVIYLTGTKEEQEKELARIRSMLGEERFKYVKIHTYCDAKAGDVTVLSYDAKASRYGIERVGKTALDIAFSVHMADILESKSVVEYRLATSFQAKDGSYTTEHFGGAATLSQYESLTGNVQIFVNPDASSIVTYRMNTLLGHSKYSGNGHIDFYDDIVDAHEFGHAHEGLSGGDVDSPSGRTMSLDSENAIRERRGMKERRLVH